MDAELSTISKATTPTARKPHKCFECRGEIAPGEKYHLFTGLWDGKWSSFKTCADCEDLRGDVCDGLDQDDWPAFGELYLDVFESRHSLTEWVTRYMDTRRKRNAPPSPQNWMEDAEAKLPNDITLATQPAKEDSGSK